MYFYLIVLSICSTSGLQCWATLFDNFSVNIVGLDGHHIGALHSVMSLTTCFLIVQLPLIPIFKKLPTQEILLPVLLLGLPSTILQL